MDQELKKQLDAWHDQDEFQKIVDAIKKIGRDQWDYEMKIDLARAYNNLGQYPKAVSLLLSVQQEGRWEGLWHFRLGYAYFYMHRLTKAKREFKRAHLLEPTDTDALIFWARTCQKGGYLTEYREAMERLKQLDYASYQDYFGPRCNKEPKPWPKWKQGEGVLNPARTRKPTE